MRRSSLARSVSLLVASVAVSGCTLVRPSLPMHVGESDTFLGTSLRARVSGPQGGQLSAPGCPSVDEKEQSVICTYPLARRYVGERIDSAQVRRDELTSLQLAGKAMVFVGLAGTAGNALFHGASTANLSWAYAAGLGYAMYSGFFPEQLRAAYVAGSNALSCVATRGDLAWAAYRNNVPSAVQRVAQARETAKLQTEGLRGAASNGQRSGSTRNTARAHAAQKVESALIRSLAAVASPTRTAAVETKDVQPGSADPTANSRFEAALASGVVSFTNLIARATNDRIDAATPTIEQVRVSAAQIGERVQAQAGAGTRVEVAVDDAAKSTVTPEYLAEAKRLAKEAEAALRSLDNADLRNIAGALAELAVATEELRVALNLASPPDFKPCVEIAIYSGVGGASLPVAVSATEPVTVVVDPAKATFALVNVTGGSGTYEVMPDGAQAGDKAVQAGTPGGADGLSQVVRGPITVRVPAGAAPGDYKFIVRDVISHGGSAPFTITVAAPPK